MRSVVTRAVTLLVQLLPLMFGSAPLHTKGLRALMICGLAKPMDTWYPAGPYSWKKLGSPIRKNESWAFWPSRVLVCSHSSPLAIRSAPGVATTPYLPWYMLAMTAWPASGDRVLPSDSYFGQVTIMPVMPACVGSLVACAEIGQASSPVEGSIVPVKAFDNGWLNAS